MHRKLPPHWEVRRVLRLLDHRAYNRDLQLRDLIQRDWQVVHLGDAPVEVVFEVGFDLCGVAHVDLALVGIELEFGGQGERSCY